MAANQRNEAYDFSLFEERESRVVRMPKKKKEKKVQKASAVEGYLRAFLLVVAAAVALSVVGYMVYCKMTLSELGDRLVNAKAELTLADSEYVRLQTDLQEKMATRSIEEQAKALGMERPQANQIEYVVINDTDKVEVAQQAQEKGFFESIFDTIAGWLS